MNKMYEILEKKEVNVEERTIVAWGSRPVQDRDGELIDSKAWDLKNFQKNPVLMLSHDYSKPPVGRVLWSKVSPDGLRFKAQFANTPAGNELFQLYKDGFMSAFSVGFVPRRWEEPDYAKDGEPKRIYKSVELLEISCVSVPSCPDALIIANEKGLIKTKDLSETISMIDVEIKKFKGVQNGEQKENPEEETKGQTTTQEEVDFDFEEVKEVVTKPDTENYVHIGVSGEEGKHSGHKIRTITISSSRGIQAHYCVDDKKITGYLFDKSKWTHEEAQAWVDSHSKNFIDYIKTIDLGEGVEEISIEDGFEILETKSEDMCECPECGKKASPEDGSCDFECPDCGHMMTEEKACGGGRKPKPKKTFENLLFKSIEPMEKPEYRERWNKSVSKLFDIAGVPSVPTNKVMELYCKFLECKVKNIYQNDFLIPFPLMGAYLAGFKACTNDYTLKDVRSFNGYGEEFPPSYEVIKINSKTEDDFLIDGTAFYEVDGEPLITSIHPTYYGIQTSIFTSRKNIDANKKLISSVHTWVEKENPLKNEKFALNGEFIDVDENDTWDTILLNDENTKVMKLVEKMVKEKEDFNGRGILLCGVPGCLDGETKVFYKRGERYSGRWISLKDLYKKFNGIGNPKVPWKKDCDTYLQSYTEEGSVIWNKLEGVLDSGYKECIKLTTIDGYSIIGTPDHPIIDENGNFKCLSDFKENDYVLQRGNMKPRKGDGKNIKDRPNRNIIWTSKYHPTLSFHKQIIDNKEYFYNRITYARCVFEANMNNVSTEEYIDILKNNQEKAITLNVLPENYDVHHIDGNPFNDDIDNLMPLTHEDHARLHGKSDNFNVEYTKMGKVLSIESVGCFHTYDIQMQDPNNNFVTDGLFFAHNTGKTKVSRILMTQTDKTFIWVSSKDLQNDYYVSDRLALGFKLARQLAPSILLMEDIDGWINGKVVDLFKTELDGLKKNRGVVTILTTNSPENLPNALLDRPGRFHDVLNFDVPTDEIRQEMISKWIGEIGQDILDEIIEKTKGYSGAHMWELIEFAKSIADDEEISLEEALIMSLGKLGKQKELISQIRGETSTKSSNVINIKVNVDDTQVTKAINKIHELDDVIWKETGSRSLPTSDNDSWDGTAAKKRMVIAAGGPVKEDIDWAKYARGFAWHGEDTENFGNYKLPFADVIDGTLTATWGGVSNAMAAVRGSRGGVDIPESDKSAVVSLLSSYYRKFDKPIPGEEDSQEKSGRVLSDKNRQTIQNAVQILNELLGSVDPAASLTEDPSVSPDTEPGMVDFEIEDMKSAEINLDQLNLVTDIISRELDEALKDYKTPDIGEIVKERIERFKGKVS